MKLFCVLKKTIIIMSIVTSAYAQKTNAIIRFNRLDYPDSIYEITQKRYLHGACKINITQIGQKLNKPTPFVCRAWLNIERKGRIVNSYYFNSIDPVGGYYGLFVPENKPSPDYFAIIKLGDYGGTLFMINKLGKVSKFGGGSYIVTKDRRILFSEVASDIPSLVVFDLKKGKIIGKIQKGYPFNPDWFTDGMNYYYSNNDSLFFFNRITVQFEGKKQGEIDLSKYQKIPYSEAPVSRGNCRCN